MHNKQEDIIRVGPISIIRIDLGMFGLAEDNATPVILLPGVHVHNDARWNFRRAVKQQELLISHGPVKFLTVLSGFIHVCYIRGQVHVYPQGRYAINDPTFTTESNSTIDLIGKSDFQQMGPVTLVRVPLGKFGFADNNSHPVVLLPGLHLVKDPKFKFIRCKACMATPAHLRARCTLATAAITVVDSFQLVLLPSLVLNMSVCLLALSHVCWRLSHAWPQLCEPVRQRRARAAQVLSSQVSVCVWYTALRN
jgi:hypothetical protein